VLGPGGPALPEALIPDGAAMRDWFARVRENERRMGRTGLPGWVSAALLHVVVFGVVSLTWRPVANVMLKDPLQVELVEPPVPLPQAPEVKPPEPEPQKPQRSAPPPPVAEIPPPPKPQVVPPPPAPLQPPPPVAAPPLPAAPVIEAAPKAEATPLAPTAPPAPAVTAPAAPPAPPAPPVAAKPAPPAPPIPIVGPIFNADYLSNPAPAYPAISKRNNEEGKVLLRVLVTAKGLPATVDIKQSSGFARLDTAAREAVLRWKFVPAKQGSEAVEAYVIVPITFALGDE
jgi:protein TonB